MKPVRGKNITWNEIKKRSNLINGIKNIAFLKSQEYILRKLMFNKLNIIGSKDIGTIKEDEISGITSDNAQIPENMTSEAVEVTEVEDGDNWYDRWRKDNL